MNRTRARARRVWSTPALISAVVSLSPLSAASASGGRSVTAELSAQPVSAVTARQEFDAEALRRAGASGHRDEIVVPSPGSVTLAALAGAIAIARGRGHRRPGSVGERGVDTAAPASA